VQGKNYFFHTTDWAENLIQASYVYKATFAHKLGKLTGLGLMLHRAEVQNSWNKVHDKIYISGKKNRIYLQMKRSLTLQ